MSSNVQKATLVPDQHNDGGAVAVLAVLAGDEAYGFPLSSVREILVSPPVAEVPRTAEHILGVISVRGQIITLLDLPKLLNLSVEEQRSRGRVLLVDNGEELIGVAVDAVIQVYRLEPAQIEYASSMGAELSDYVLGIGRMSSSASTGNHDMLILIDPVSLLGE